MNIGSDGSYPLGHFLQTQTLLLMLIQPLFYTIVCGMMQKTDLAKTVAAARLVLVLFLWSVTPRDYPDRLTGLGRREASQSSFPRKAWERDKKTRILDWMKWRMRRAKSSRAHRKPPTMR